MNVRLTKAKLPINALDLALIIVIALSVFGFVLARSGHAGVNKVIQGTTKVAIKVYVAGLKTEDTNLFKVGNKAAITIRNQPVQPPMTIVAVKHWPKLVSFLAPDGKCAIALPDPAYELVQDFLITVSDQAEVTADGYVIRGNKIKVGNSIELEGFKYRVQGVVVNLNSI